MRRHQNLLVATAAALLLLATIGLPSAAAQATVANPTPASSAAANQLPQAGGSSAGAQPAATAVQFPVPSPATAPAAAATPPAAPQAQPQPAAAAAATPATAPAPAAAAATPATAPAPAAAAPPANQSVPSSSPVAVGPVVTQLSNFTSVEVCAPLTVLIVASNGTSHSLTVDAKTAVRSAITANVTNNTLYIGVNGSFDSTKPIKVAVNVPGSTLTAATARGVASVVLSPTVANSRIIALALSALGTSSVAAPRVAVDNMTVNAEGTSRVDVRGDVASANVTASGTSRVTLSGVTKSVTGTLDGISQLLVDPASGSTTVNVDTSGLSKVLLTQGKCTTPQGNNNNNGFGMLAPFFNFRLSLAGCTSIPASSFPSLNAPHWSCGVRVRGSATCPALGATTATNGATAGSAGASADTSNDDDHFPGIRIWRAVGRRALLKFGPHDPLVRVEVNGRDGADAPGALAVASLNCDVPNQQLQVVDASG